MNQGMKQGKVWGVTKCLVENPFCERHRIEIAKGGTCSKHKHLYKTNGFYVEKGRLLIRVWKTSYDLIDETILDSGDYMVVPPNELHSFEALEDTIAFELYFPTPIGNDIVRESVGSMKGTPVQGNYTK